MKIRIFAFSRDLRSDQQRAQYQTIEQKRADAWLDIYMSRLTRVQILKRQVNLPVPSLMRRQAS